MKHFEFDLTPAKAYDLNLFLELNNIPVPQFISNQAANFLSLSTQEKIQAKLEARKGRLLLGSDSVFETIKVFSILNQYVKNQNLGKILIVYQYRPMHDKKEYLNWVTDVVKSGFDLSDEDISLNSDDFSRRVYVSTNHKVDYFDLVSSFDPEYFIFCGMRKQGMTSSDLYIIPSMVEHFTSVVFDTDFNGTGGLMNQCSWASAMFNDTRGGRPADLDQFIQNCIRNNDKIKERKLMEFMGIEKV